MFVLFFQAEGVLNILYSLTKIIFFPDLTLERRSESGLEQGCPGPLLPENKNNGTPADGDGDRLRSRYIANWISYWPSRK